MPIVPYPNLATIKIIRVRHFSGGLDVVTWGLMLFTALL